METKIKKSIVTSKSNGLSKTKVEAPHRIHVRKTYKLFIDGKFPRTESGRFTALKDNQGLVIANFCRASKKDLRDAIVSNRKVQNDWAKRSAYNKAQILYRIAETLEGRKAQFVEGLVLEGYSPAKAKSEVNASIDLLVYYAGWSDKYIQIFSAVNPVESAHFNFSYPEPTGVVTILAPQSAGLLGMISHLAPVIIGGNTCTIIAADKYPLTAVDFAEVLNASDLPGGVINILTGQRKEFIAHASTHMDVNAIVFSDLDVNDKKTVQINSAINVKRAVDFSKEPIQSPYRILNCNEIKTTWHPMGI